MFNLYIESQETSTINILMLALRVRRLVRHFVFRVCPQKSASASLPRDMKLGNRNTNLWALQGRLGD